MPATATLVQDRIEEPFSYFAFPREHRRSLRTITPLERMMREIRRRTPYRRHVFRRNSTFLLVSARLHHIAGKTWGAKRYLT